MLEIRHPEIGSLFPMFSTLDLKPSVVGHQETKLETTIVRGLQVEFQTGMLGILLDPLLVNRLGVVVPIPAEGKEFDAVVSSEFNLLLHNLRRIVAPTPQRLAIGELFDHASGEVGWCRLGPGLVGIISPSATSGPSIKIVGANRYLGLTAGTLVKAALLRVGLRLKVQCGDGAQKNQPRLARGLF